MNAPINFYFACASPWSYLALDALVAIGDAHKRSVAYTPIDVERAWDKTGTGRPLGQKPAALRGYRDLDLPRWAAYRGIDIDPAPKSLAAETKFLTSRVIVAASQSGVDVYPLVRAFMRACWVDNQNISDPPTVVAIADEAGFAGAALLAAANSAAVQQYLEANTAQALADGVWSVPSIIVDGELFYGQDRLEMIAWRLSGSPDPHPRPPQ
jgi:2-hydroxychromene-2-carboxylate isomerase